MLRNRRKNQIPPLPRSPFPKHTPATFFPLRVLWQGSSLGESLHFNDAALTGRNGTQGHSLAFNGGCVWGTFACAGLPVFHRSVNPYAAATHLFDSRSCAALSGNRSCHAEKRSSIHLAIPFLKARSPASTQTQCIRIVAHHPIPLLPLSIQVLGLRVQP